MKFRIPTFTLPKLDAIVWVAGGIAVVVVLVFAVWLIKGTSIIIENRHPVPLSSLTGQPCENAENRPIAVMFASDPEARPLSGIGAADMVFEMPVTPNGITRMMAVFQCREPKEVGSIRSARGPFIPLAQGLGTVLVHWGGERDALEQLDNHIIDNVDGLKYDGTETFYRKSSIPRPHNGFSTLSLVRDRADMLGYASASALLPYPHTSPTPERNLGSLVTVASVAWPQGMDVAFRYDNVTNTYARWRGGTPEIDATTGAQVRASVVVVMHTDATFIYDQYISMRMTGQGTAEIYQNGRRTSALWKKPTARDMVTFVDNKERPIPFVPGPVWVEITAPLPQP